jgi:hypothetical protein
MLDGPTEAMEWIGEAQTRWDGRSRSSRVQVESGQGVVDSTDFKASEACALPSLEPLSRRLPLPPSSSFLFGLEAFSTLHQPAAAPRREPRAPG